MLSSKGYIFLSILLLSLIIGCQSGSTISKVTTGKMVSLDPSQTGISFTNRLNESAKRNSIQFDYFYNGAGVAIGDIDNDGLSDIFFTGNDAPNVLYKNLGNMEFEDITSQAKIPLKNRWATGVNMVDINGDGFLDIYIGYGGMDNQYEDKIDEFLINDGTGKFVNKILDFGLSTPVNTMHTSFFDYDNDGDLDLWINTHGNFRGKIKEFYENTGKASKEQLYVMTTKLYRNDDLYFTDVTEQAGVYNYNFGLGLATVDLNDDNLIDIYVANDYFMPDYYFINKGDGTFEDQINTRLDHSSFFSMGCDVADINNDELLDIAVVDMTPADHVRNKRLMASMNVKEFKLLTEDLDFNRQYMFNSIQLALGQRYFNEVGKSMGVSQSDWSWAALFADFDNDTYKDFYIANGYLRDTKDNDFRSYMKKNGTKYEDMTEEIFAEYLKVIPTQPITNKMYSNNKGESFKDYTQEWTNNQPSFSNGAAYGDLDNDGDLDLVVNNINSPATVLENQLTNNNYIGIKLVNPPNPAEVVNAKISVHTGSQILRYDYYFSRGYLSSVDQRILCGIGENTTVEKIEITWLDNSTSKIINPQINTYHTYSKVDLPTEASTPKESAFRFRNITSGIPNFKFQHQENVFDDFEKEILLPHKYSTLGPALTVADFTGNSKDDLFMGSAIGKESRLLIQEGNTFIETRLAGSSRFEDIGSLSFDADKDGDLDLFITTGGGGDIGNNQSLLVDRLYLNTNGQFKLKANAVPPSIKSSNSASVAIDFDKDGDLDLWTFGRNKPGKYPQRENSYLLENDSAIFTDITNSELQSQLPGMITDAIVVNYNNDNYEDIIITSEWEKPYLLIGQKDEPFFNLEPLQGLENKKGWWQSITAIDLDGDGDEDYIIGNLGKNNKFQPSQEKPLGVLATDFDDSGSLDIVLTKKYKGKTVPVRGKQCSTEQMPFLEAKIPSYSLFANSGVEDLFDADKLNEADKMEVTTFESVVLWNDGGSYSAVPLPFMAQLSPILDAVAMDINNDGIEDLVLGGNLLDTEPETPSYDSGKGVILYGNKERNITAEYNINKTGIYLNNNTRQLDKVRLSGGQTGLVVAPNNNYLQLYLKL